jgi:hypothetical protein
MILKAQKLFYKLVLAILTVVVSNVAQAQTTAFNFSGRLSEVGLPVTGVYDFRFTVFGSLDLNDVISGPITNNQVGVKGGVFNTRLDFGDQTFTGAARWLRVEVRRTGTSTYTNLSPRIEITTAPYAIRARSAAIADNISGGAVVKSLNNLTNHVTLAAGANVSIVPSGNTLTINSSGGGGGSWSTLSTNTYYNTGNVGIGTSTPTSRLDVRGFFTLDSGGNAVLFTGTGGGELNRYLSLFNSPNLASASGLKAGGVLVSDSYAYANPGKNDLIVKGKVGIGTPTPTAPLTVQSSSGDYGLEHTDGDVSVGSYVSAAGGWLGTRTDDSLHFFVNDGLAGMTLNLANNVGIGTTTPATRLDVAGDITGNRLVLRADPLAPTHASLLCADGGVTTFVPYNTTTARPLNMIVRDATVRQLTITGGADLAEPFLMSHSGIAKGSVVVIDEHNPGKLKLSTSAYNKCVAGIVSGANGVNPGISLYQEGLLEGGENVALSGRVYVHADASYGAIKPGDLLTTSDTAGHAMRVTDPIKAQGAVLGKAMSSLAEGKGMVLVLVTLQ